MKTKIEEEAREYSNKYKSGKLGIINTAIDAFIAGAEYVQSLHDWQDISELPIPENGEYGYFRNIALKWIDQQITCENSVSYKWIIARKPQVTHFKYIY